MISILLVDDEPELLEIEKTFLEKAGDLQLVLACSAKEALDILDNKDIDVIVSDYMMPGMDGIELLREIRSAEDNRPFILFTGKGREEVAIEALNLGANRYIQKGGSIEAQFQVLEGALRDEVSYYQIRMDLRESKERLELANKVAEYGIWDWDLDSGKIYFSDRYFTMLGYEPGELPMEVSTWINLMHPDDREEVVPLVKQWAKMGMPFEISFRMRTKKGDWRWISGRGKLFERDDSGKPHRMVGTHTDITERKLREERIKHLNQVLLSIRNVNQLIAKELDDERLIQRSCELLTEKRGYFNTWIALFSDDGRCRLTANSGFDDEFDVIEEMLDKGKLTRCGEIAMKKPGIKVTYDPMKECADCPLHGFYGGRAGYTMRLEHMGKVFGVLSASIPFDLADEEEERELFGEVAGDIGFALHSIELERKRNEAEINLKESEEKFRSYIMNCPLGAFITDREGHFIDVNESACAITGYTREELLSMSIYDTIPEDALDAGQQHFGDLLEKGEAYGELPFINKNGERRWWAVNAVQLSEDRFLGFAEDITDRKRMEEELYLTKFSVDSVALELYWISSDGRILSTNRGVRDVLGYSSEELREMSIWDIDPLPEHAPEKRKERWDMLKEKGELTFETRHVTKDGKMIDVEVTAKYIEFEGKEYEFTIARDISLWKKMERELRLANEKLYMIGGITRHDILNQLMNIIGYVELAQEEKDNKQFLENVLAASGRIKKIIELGSEYEKIGAESAIWIDVKQAIDIGLSTVDLDDVNVEIDVGEIGIMADPMFEKVFNNLLDNAIRHGGARNIRIFTEQADDSLRLIVEDDGTGIDHDRKEGLFEYHTGFGLSFIKELLSITEITIRENGEPGAGARFEMTVPNNRFR